MSLAPSLTRSSELLTVPLIQEVFDDHDDCDRDDDDIYIMMKYLSVCLSRKMITSSLESL